jgi:hypothetical protein
VGLGNPFRGDLRVRRSHPPDQGHDNNLPNTGRNPTIADDTELIVVKVPDVLEQD